MFQTIILYLLTFVSGALPYVTPVCKPYTGEYSGPALPSLPSVFSTKFEGSFLNRNMSLSGEEYFDNTTDQLAIMTSTMGRRHYSIYNYRNDEGIRIDLVNGNCTVFKLSKHFRFLPRPRYDKQGHEHIGSISDFFRFGKQYNETFIGKTVVRGTRVLQWQSCINHGNHSYTLDWYFSVPEWMTVGGKSPIPVRCVVNGTGYSYRTHKFHTFYHVYDFTDFLPGLHPSQSKFQPPFGTYCKNREPGKSPPKLPVWFSNSVEIINTKGKTAGVVIQHYDMERKLVRVDHQPWRKEKKSLFLVEIQDFNTGVSYSIDDVKSTCTMTPLNNTWYGIHDGDDDIHMKPPFQLFWYHNESIKYEGVAVIRGIETNVWVSRGTTNRRGQNVTYIYEWYFSHPTWFMNAGQIKNQTEVPILLRIWTNGTAVMSMNIFNFDGENPNLRKFDVGKCFLWTKADRRMANILFIGDYDMLVSQQTDLFLNMVMAEISKQIGITLLRMSGISVYGYSNIIWVKLIILKRPSVEGITVHMAMKEPELDEAFEKLKNVVEEGKLKVTMQGHPTPISAETFYESNDFDKPKPQKPGKREKRVSVVGVAIGSVLLGLLIGVLVCFITLKRRGVNLFSYQRHNDEL